MNDSIPSRKNWYIRDGTINKELQMDSLVEMYIGYMFDRTIMMFNYENLPDGITNKDMEKFTQMQGQSFFIKHNGRAYILNGTFSDNITWNYEFKNALIVNPALPDLKTKYTLNEDCVCLPNDSHYIGLYPLMEKNAIQLASTDISLMFASFNTRLKTLFTSDDDNNKESLDQLISDIWDGKKLTSIVTEDLYKKSIEGVTYNQGQSTDIKDLIELKQYIKANWYIDLGINANYNMKREAINESESQMNDDALVPLIDDMLMVREQAVDKINELFGYDIKVSLSSAWEHLRKEIEMEETQEELMVEQLEEAKSDDNKEEGVKDEETQGSNESNNE